MRRLTNEGFWNEGYKTQRATELRPRANTFKRVVEELLGRRVVQYLRDYDDYLLWDVIYKTHIPFAMGTKAVEIGSAPGDHLVRLNCRYGVIPYGVEYTEAGAEVNRRMFTSNNLNPANVIQEDFFCESFQQGYKEYFDVVISRGFIEHFDDVDRVIDKHLNILKTQGYIVVSIPNFRGFYRLWLRLFRKHLLPLHNLTIMQKDEFARLFQGRGIAPIFCGYYGTFTLNLLRTNPQSLFRFAITLLKPLQRLFNVAFRLLFGNEGMETSYWSPFLLFIGVKQSSVVSQGSSTGSVRN